jgi:transcriptional regulator with XRE-family HTH domain
MALDYRGMTPAELADAMGVARSTVNRWVSGETLPHIAHIKPLADVLGVHASLLYDPPELPNVSISDFLIRSWTLEVMDEIAAKRRQAAPPRPIRPARPRRAAEGD